MKLRFVLQWFMLAGIVLASIYFSIQNLRATTTVGNPNVDTISQWELRFDPIKKILPFKRGVIGYITNSDVPGMGFDPSNEEGEYTLTQYAMSPIILVRGDNEEWTIANLSSKAFQAWSQLNRDKFRIIPMNDNLYLLQRLTP